MQTQIGGIGTKAIWAKVPLKVSAPKGNLRGGRTIKKTSRNDEFVDCLRAIANKADRQAFQDLFGHFAPRVKTYLLGLKVSGDEANDLVQEVFLTVWRKAHQYDPAKAYVSTWIFTIARNRLIDTRRKEKRFPADALKFEAETTNYETGDKVLEAKQQSKRVLKALSKLPADQQQGLRMAFLEGKTHSEVSTETGLPLGTIKSRIRLAFEKMRIDLETAK
jgi:RNA polymerase sigma-70 factor (ECF subfamily)